MTFYEQFDGFAVPDELYELNLDDREDRLSRLRELANEIEGMHIPDAMIESAIAFLEDLLNDAGNC